MAKNNDIFHDIAEAKVGDKRPSSTANEDPTISIKKQGRIVLNRPSASTFLGKGHKYVLMMMNKRNRRLFLKSASKDDPKAHRIAFGRGGIPGLIIGKAALESMGFDLSESRPSIKVESHEVSEDMTVGPYQLHSGDVILAADVPSEFLKAGVDDEPPTDTSSNKRGKDKGKANKAAGRAAA
jgi:hypothetical protein